MTVEQTVLSRADNSCELCGHTADLEVLGVAPKEKTAAENCIVQCGDCKRATPYKEHANHWRCLQNSMWSQEPAVQVTAWRILKQLQDDWAANCLSMLVLEPEVAAWAEPNNSEQQLIHRDSNGQQLQSGDAVTLIKDLNVKGAGFTAKRGTLVKNISTVSDNSEHIEGRVNGQQIVILCQFVKKA